MIAILWYQLDVSGGGSVFKFTVGGNQPLGKPCYSKRLGKTLCYGYSRRNTIMFLSFILDPANGYVLKGL